jgi:hypothetical protein
VDGADVVGRSSSHGGHVQPALPRLITTPPRSHRTARACHMSQSRTGRSPQPSPPQGPHSQRINETLVVEHLNERIPL